MKPLLILMAVVSLTACSRAEQQPAANDSAAQPAETQPQAPAAQPALSTAASTGTAGAVEPTQAPAASPAKPATPPARRPATPAAPARTAATPSAPAADLAATAAATPPAAAPAPQQAPAAAPAPPPKPAPEFRNVTIPAGTSLTVTVLSHLASNTSTVEDQVRGSLASPLVIDGLTVAPTGSDLRGVVTEVAESGRVRGKARMAFRFENLIVRGQTLDIQTAPVKLEADDKKTDDVKRGGIGAGLGAVVGGIAGGGTGAAIGAVTGGAGTVLATKGREVGIDAGTQVNVLVQESFVVRVPLK